MEPNIQRFSVARQSADNKEQVITEGTRFTDGSSVGAQLEQLKISDNQVQHRKVRVVQSSGPSHFSAPPPFGHSPFLHNMSSPRRLHDEMRGFSGFQQMENQMREAHNEMERRMDDQRRRMEQKVQEHHRLMNSPFNDSWGMFNHDSLFPTQAEAVMSTAQNQRDHMMGPWREQLPSSDQFFNRNPDVMQMSNSEPPRYQDIFNDPTNEGWNDGSFQNPDTNVGHHRHPQADAPKLNESKRSDEALMSRNKGNDGTFQNTNTLHHRYPPTESLKFNENKQNDAALMPRNKHHDAHHRAQGSSLEQIIDEKLSILGSMEFGQNFQTINGNLDAHRVFQREVEDLGHRVSKAQDSADLQTKYQNLQENSKAHLMNLLSLKDYVEHCDKELELLKREISERILYDWRNDNPDYQNRLQHYEDFVANVFPKMEFGNLIADGQKLMDEGHPGNTTIQVHMNEVHGCQQDLHNLLECEAFHLRCMKFQAECTDIEKLLKQQESKLEDIKEVKHEYLLFRALTIMTDIERSMAASEKQIKDFQTLHLEFAPLSEHWTPPSVQQSVMALCDVTTEKVTLVKNNWYTLINQNNENWNVKDSAGTTMTAPGVYFLIPPDPKLIPVPERLENQRNSIKEKMTKRQPQLKNQLSELKKNVKGDYMKPKMIKGKIIAVKMERENKCDFCNYKQKNFNMDDDMYKCENEKCKLLQLSQNFIHIDGEIVMKAKYQRLSLKVPTLVVKGYLQENNMLQLLKDNGHLEKHFMLTQDFEIMFDK